MLIRELESNVFPSAVIGKKFMDKFLGKVTLIYYDEVKETILIFCKANIVRKSYQGGRSLEVSV